jgi:hypothetical protein
MSKRNFELINEWCLFVLQRKIGNFEGDFSSLAGANVESGGDITEPGVEGDPLSIGEGVELPDPEPHVWVASIGATPPRT